MERRVLLAIVLSFVALYVSQAILTRFVPRTSTPSSAGSPATSASVAPPQAEKNPEAAAAAPAAASTATTLVGDASEREIRVENRDVIAVFTNRGARLKSWRLKHFLDGKGQPLDLVATDLATPQPLPFSLRVSDEATTATLNGALYAAHPTTAQSPDGATDVEFEYRDNSGLHATKAYHLDASSFVVSVRVSVAQDDRALSPVVQWGPAVGDVSEVNRFTVHPEALLWPNGGKVQRLAAKDLAKQSTFEGDFTYAGVDDQYFLIAAISVGPSRISYQAISVPPPAGSKDPPRELVAFAVEPMRSTDLKVFAGPKDFDVLRSVDPRFINAINFGMFDFLVVPLLRSLKWINGFIGNYGWSIIILTIIINAIMFPLRHKSVVSMRKMQQLQPEVKAIQDRYAKLKTTDPAKQKMNQELMALYRERGVNPASGCVPMLLTMPVLFAFYSLLSTAIELRGAPFVGWIHDLSIHDPLYITPVLMGLSQVWQTRITPATGADPAQQKMMMLMPIFFTFMFLWAPAGVAIYWFMSNLWGIGQQYLTNYLIGPAPVRTPPRPPAERRMKRVGGGKTEAAARDS